MLQNKEASRNMCSLNFHFLKAHLDDGDVGMDGMSICAPSHGGMRIFDNYCLCPD